MTLVRGTVVLVELDPTLGHEQRGVRPCLVVSDPAVNADRCLIVDATGTFEQGAGLRITPNAPFWLFDSCEGAKDTAYTVPLSGAAASASGVPGASKERNGKAPGSILSPDSRSQFSKV